MSVVQNHIIQLIKNKTDLSIIIAILAAYEAEQDSDTYMVMTLGLVKLIECPNLAGFLLNSVYCESAKIKTKHIGDVWSYTLVMYAVRTKRFKALLG